MGNTITVYHGSAYIVESPKYGTGRTTNDYGLGFYLTENKSLAGEWAVLWTGTDGYINEYKLNLEGLRIANLDQLPIESWISTLMVNRKGEYADELQERLAQFVAKFGVDLSPYDVIKGYRANDAFFRYVEAFTIGVLSKENLMSAMKLGDLGMQICLKSRESFQAVQFVASSRASAEVYHRAAQDRDASARRQYRLMPNKGTGTTIFDMLREDYHAGL